MKYLKKKKMYELAKIFIGDKVPIMKECGYKFYSGYETLSFNIYQESEDRIISYEFTSLSLGKWIHIEAVDDSLYVVEISNYGNKYKDPIHPDSYGYASSNGKVLRCL